MKHRKNGKKENNKLNKQSINNQESFKVSVPLSQRDGRKLNKSQVKFMVLQNKNYIK